MNDFFHKIAERFARSAGSPWAFMIAVSLILIWGLTGPAFNYSDTWQLVINTATTIVTFLMVFLIQNTQYRDARAIHLKLDELIRANRAARNELLDLEHCSEEELEQLEKDFEELRRHFGEHHEIVKKERGKRKLGETDTASG